MRILVEIHADSSKWYLATRSTLEYKNNITFLNEWSFQFQLIVLLPFSRFESHVSQLMKKCLNPMEFSVYESS